MHTFNRSSQINTIFRSCARVFFFVLTRLFSGLSVEYHLQPKFGPSFFLILNFCISLYFSLSHFLACVRVGNRSCCTLMKWRVIPSVPPATGTALTILHVSKLCSFHVHHFCGPLVFSFVFFTFHASARSVFSGMHGKINDTPKLW